MAGSVEAVSEQDVIRQLREMKITPVSVSPAAAPPVRKDPAPSFRGWGARRVEGKDRMVFCINLATMVSAGVPLLGALNMIGGQLTHKYFGSAVRQAAMLVSEGTSLSDALARFPDAFSMFFVNMVRVGEASGTMDAVLRTLADHLEKEDNLRQKVTGALIYPMILVVAGIGAILVILTFVMPQFVLIFTRSNVPLPLPTRLTYGAGMWLKQNGFLFFLSLAGSAALFQAVLRTRRGLEIWERLTLNVPVLGALLREVLVTRFSRTLATLLNAGVPLLQALDILRKVIDNTVFAGIVSEIQQNVEKGERISTTLKDHREFPPDVVYMIAVGEESSRVGEMLSKVADFYESRVEFAIKEAVVYIEPVFICFLAVIVGGMLASVILPMFDLIKTIQR